MYCSKKNIEIGRIMKNKPSLKKNVLFNMAYQVLNLLAPFITTPYISRVLGADGVGIYSFTNSIVLYFTMFAALGTVAYGTREISRNRYDKKEVSKLFYEIEFLTVITTLICLCVWMLFIFITNSNYKIYYIILSLTLVATLFDISWFYAGLEEFKYTVTQNAIFKVLGIVALFVFVKSKGDTAKYVLIMSLTILLGNMSMWIYLPKFIERVPVRSLKVLHHFKETLIYFIPTIAISIYTILDKTLIGLITHSNFENGYYEQATKVINMVKSLTFYPINVVLGSRMALLFAESKEKEIKENIIKSMDIIFLIGYGAIFGIVGVADRFVPIFFGQGYDHVVILLRYMSLLVIIVSVSNCLGSQYYTPAGLRSKSAIYIIIGAVVNLILNLCFIPILGSVGAVVGSIVAEGTISGLYLVNCNNYLSIKDLFNISKKRVLSGFLMFLAVSGIGKITIFHNSITLLCQMIIGVILYFLILIILRDSMLISVLKTLKGKMVR